jgi:hypothetical protein
MSIDKLKEMIRGIIDEMNNEEEIEEISTTGGVAGYNTPKAFGRPEDEKEKAKRMAKSTGYSLVGEGTNRYQELRKEDATANQKIGKGIREMRKQIQEIEKFVEWYSKIKTESDLDSSQYWKRTQRHLNVIRERLNKISQKIQNLSA